MESELAKAEALRAEAAAAVKAEQQKAQLEAQQAAQKSSAARSSFSSWEPVVIQLRVRGWRPFFGVFLTPPGKSPVISGELRMDFPDPLDERLIIPNHSLYATDSHTRIGGLCPFRGVLFSTGKGGAD